MQMPGTDGIELGRNIKADPALKNTRMIMLTSRGIRGDYTAMKRIGFDGYLIKPIGRNQLFDCIVTVLARNRSVENQYEKPLVTRHTLSDDRVKKVRILLAEDNIINQKLALRLLEKFGFQADAVANGEEAIKALEIINYDIVLMDIQMPVMDGYRATAVIRRPESKVLNHDVKIIALTAHAMKGDREKCLEAGMDSYISKPINPNELYSVIDQYL
jgi:CheY-like chemotaxis protein